MPSSAWIGRASCREDRKSTRLNSSHTDISYAVFCLKKKTLSMTHSRTLYCQPIIGDHSNVLPAVGVSASYVTYRFAAFRTTQSLSTIRAGEIAFTD